MPTARWHQAPVRHGRAGLGTKRVFHKAEALAEAANLLAAETPSAIPRYRSWWTASMHAMSDRQMLVASALDHGGWLEPVRPVGVAPEAQRGLR